MKKEINPSSKKRDKKMVDLIYLDENKLGSDLEIGYREMINSWSGWANINMEMIFKQEILIEEQAEYFSINNFLKNFLTRRLDWIFESVTDLELRNKYLLALPPFNQQGNIKNFLLHFFQLEISKNSPELKYVQFNKSEREVRILWDVYTLGKSAESIEVLKKFASEEVPFSSVFSSEHIMNQLNTLHSALCLLMKICVKKEYHQEIIYKFPMHCFNPESILNRKVTDNYMINDVVLEKFDYRNYFFHLFFGSGMKAMYNEKKLVFKYNYLDFEIIRQEFLIHWLNNKLAGNPNKKEVFSRFMIDGKTFNQIIEENPEEELTILKLLPKYVFNELIAEVNEVVSEKFKTPVNPMSERMGEFAKHILKFEKAKELAQKTIQAFRHYMTRFENKPKEKPNDSTTSTEKLKKKEISTKIDFYVDVLKKSEIDCPYFCIDVSKFKAQLVMLKRCMQSSEFTSFNNKVQMFLTDITESKLLKRRTTILEWSVPYLIKEMHGEMIRMHLLILGAEVRNKKLGMGQGSDGKEKFELKPYFVYGSQEQHSEMGYQSESRTVQGEKFCIYSFTNPAVIKKALQLTEIVINK